jgi:hypothetical protein
VILGQEVKKSMEKDADPVKQLETMWIAYWNFAFEHKELYQLMYGVEMNCCYRKNEFAEAELSLNLFFEKIKEVMTAEEPDKDLVFRKFYTFWSVIHGLISINLVNRGRGQEMNQQILQDAIKGIIKYINE